MLPTLQEDQHDCQRSDTRFRQRRPLALIRIIVQVLSDSPGSICIHMFDCRQATNRIKLETLFSNLKIVLLDNEMCAIFNYDFLPFC